MILKRDAVPGILRGAQYFPVIAIVGPRQSGKTTLAQNAFPNHAYLSLEDPDLRVAAKTDPRTFLQANKNDFGIIIDEFQYVPELLSYIQTIVDAQQKPGYFVLTGSQNFLINESITQSLAGRVSIHTLLPLSIHELANNNVLPTEIEAMLYQGCYPAIYAKKTPPDLLYKNYLQTYIERDVRLLAQVGDLTTFQIFLTQCAARIGQQLNLSTLGNECGISDTTVKRWLSILQASYIIFLLQPYHSNITKRLVKTPKLYFYDPGLATYLLKMKEQELAIHPNRGNLFETLIISDIFKWHYNHGISPSIYFWRNKTGNEVDCIVDINHTLVPIEIKASRTTSQRFFEGLTYWNIANKKEENHGFVIFGGDAQQARGYTNVVSWQKIDTILPKLDF